MKFFKKFLKAVLPNAVIRKLRAVTVQGSVQYLVVIVGNACSLKCKNCANFCPQAKKENKRYDVNQIIQDLSNVIGCTTKIKLLQIQGGEPFLYTDLSKLLDFCSSQKKIKKITIATNGTIMPSDSLLEKIKNKGIQIRISNYPVSQKKGHELYEKCVKMGIDCYIYNFAYGKDEWADCGGIETPREVDDEIVSLRFSECAFKDCLTLENGELNRCSRLYIAHTLQNFERRDDDHINVRNTDGLKERLKKFLRNPSFAEGCRYCYGNSESNSRRILPGEQE